MPKGTVVLSPMRDKVRPVCVERHRDLGAQICMESSVLSNSRALATTGGGQRVILARSRVLSRCHSGFAGVLKRDSDFLFSLCVSLFPWWFWLPRRDYNRRLAPLSMGQWPVTVIHGASTIHIAKSHFPDWGWDGNPGVSEGAGRSRVLSRLSRDRNVASNAPGQY